MDRRAVIEAHDRIAEAKAALRALETLLGSSRERALHDLAYLLDPVIASLTQAEQALRRIPAGRPAPFRKEK